MDKQSRRQTLRQVISLPVLGSAAALFAACGNDSGGLECNDTSGLSSQDKQFRETQKYTDVSKDPKKNCYNCNFYEGTDKACGTCKVIKGPVSPKGNCNLWAAKAG